MSLVHDEPASRHLLALLRESGERLATLGSQPVAIACATDKFNDSGYDDFWCAVRVGPYFWEQSQFFSEPDVRKIGFATERAHAPVHQGGEGTALLRQTSFDTARVILDDLERADWRALTKQAFGRDPGSPIFALVRQFDQLWLSISEPISSDPGMLTAILPDRFVHVGAFVERMDELIGKPNLIPLRELRQEALLCLSSKARHQFRPDSILCMTAARELRDMLLAAAASIRAETSEVVIVTLRPARWGERGGEYPSSYHMGPKFQVRDVHYSAERGRQVEDFRIDEATRRTKLVRYESISFEKIEEGLRPLEKTHARGLFEAAVGVDTFGADELLFVVAGDERYLLQDKKLFAVAPEPDAPDSREGPEDEAPIRLVGYVRFDTLRQKSSEWIDCFDPSNPDYVDPVLPE